MADQPQNPSPQRPTPETTPPGPAPPEVRTEAAQARPDRPVPAREPVVGSRAEGEPGAEPEGERRARTTADRPEPPPAESGPEPEPEPESESGPEPEPAPRGPAGRVRQDEGLGPDDVVELTVRLGVPPGGWVDIPARDGLRTLLQQKETIGARGQGVNVIAGHAEYVDPALVRELRASAFPARVVRRAAEGG